MYRKFAATGRDLRDRTNKYTLSPWKRAVEASGAHPLWLTTSAEVRKSSSGRVPIFIEQDSGNVPSAPPSPAPRTLWVLMRSSGPIFPAAITVMTAGRDTATGPEHFVHTEPLLLYVCADQRELEQSISIESKIRGSGRALRWPDAGTASRVTLDAMGTLATWTKNVCTVRAQRFFGSCWGFPVRPRGDLRTVRRAHAAM